MIPIIDYKNGGEKTIERILSRSQLDYGNVQEIVDGILTDVRKNGDKAVFEYTKKFDAVDIDKNSIVVSDEEIKYAYSQVKPELLEIIKKSAQRIKDFHQKQKRNSWFETSENGEIMGQMVRPLENVGV